MSTDRRFGLIGSQSDAHTPREYNKIKIGKTVLKDDAFLNTDFLKPKQRKMKRSEVEQAIDRQDLKKIRAISEYFYYSNGIYERLCRYMAYIYRYD